MKHLINFLDQRILPACGTMLKSVIVSVLTMSVVFLLKTYVLKPLGLLFNRAKGYVQNKLRRLRGNLTFGELSELQRKKEAGEALTGREKEMLFACEKEMKEILKKYQWPK